MLFTIIHKEELVKEFEYEADTAEEALRMFREDQIDDSVDLDDMELSNVWDTVYNENGDRLINA